MDTLNAIPVLDLKPEIEELWDELNEAFQRVLRSRQFILGSEVDSFEREVADYLDVKHAVGVNSGTDALVIGLRCLGIGMGDEVITTPFTFFSTAEAISQVGATPVFTDIDPGTFNLNPEYIEEQITDRTRAILPVHLYGRPAEMERIRAIADKHSLRILEDVAQAFSGEYRGKKVGTLGDIGAFSFFPSKNLGAFGDGGLVATDDDDMAEMARMLRAHGSRKKYFNEILGYNSRLDTLQAAILRVKLGHIEEWSEGRRAAAKRYNELLAGLDGIETPTDPDDARHVYHQYTIRVTGGHRDDVAEGLKRAGISTMIYYPVPVSHLPIYSALPNNSLVEAVRAAREVLSLPLWPKITFDIQKRVVNGIRDVFHLNG